MSDHENSDRSGSSRIYKEPYSAYHPIPNIQDYGEAVHVRDKYATHQKQNKTGIFKAAKERLLHSKQETGRNPTSRKLYNSQNLNCDFSSKQDDDGYSMHHASTREESTPCATSSHDTRATGNHSKTMAAGDQKSDHGEVMRSEHQGRWVTDPVTHLPIYISDSTCSELGSMPENQVPTDGLRNHGDIDHGSQDDREQKAAHRGIQALFPPPSYDAIGKQLASILKTALTAGLSIILGVVFLLLFSARLCSRDSQSLTYAERKMGWSYFSFSFNALLLLGVLLGILVLLGLRTWAEKKFLAAWEDGMWDALRTREIGRSSDAVPESVQWLNSLLRSIWPLVNPDLFTGLADTLEDVMQASLPRLVRMISIDDLGQGNEAFHLLGIKWLPAGDAKKDVSASRQAQGSHRENSETGSTEIDADPHPEGTMSAEADLSDKGEALPKGMEAEEGNFVNVEVGFSYRAPNSSKTLRFQAKNAHLYLIFYLPGGIQFPVWVELRGMVGSMRMRLQLCPDPPFVALCTLTLLGQPKVELSCVPLAQKGLNIMNLPLVSSFVQRSIDAALAEYVAPKSLTLDLKGLLVGDEFKTDVTAKGVLVIRIIGAVGFKEGDSSLGGLRDGSSDPYVAVGWAKFGKPVWSTRIIHDNMEPVWEETAFVLVGPNELNAAERLRVQLWDSDRTSADDDLGRVEVDLEVIMSDQRSFTQMWHRCDGFRALNPDEEMPGKLTWSVGYFPKSRIQKKQLEGQTLEPDIRTVEQLECQVTEDVRKKMREASNQDQSPEVRQQEAQDLKIREDNMVASTCPSQEFPAGILSLQIHQLSGVEFEHMNKPRDATEGEQDTVAESDDLPSSYCTVILNHQSIFKTRTKPKTSEPFFNAATERFIRDWRSTELMVSVRDARIHENDPLMGLIYLPLRQVLRHKSQVIESYPIVGGIGYGRARISLVFRSVRLQLPAVLQLPTGWEYGTVDVAECSITESELPPSLHNLRLKISTSLAHGKVYPGKSNAGKKHWYGRRGRNLRLAVQQRYRSCLVVEFRKNRLGLDGTSAFAILWLQNIPDDEEVSIRLPIFHGEKAALVRAASSYSCDDGEQIGFITIVVKFWRGLNRFHRGLARKNTKIHHVLEVLSTAMDNREVESAIIDDEEGAEEVSRSNSDDGQSDSDEPDGFRDELKAASGTRRTLGDEDGNSRSRETTSLRHLQGYNDHSDQLHRHNRGLMQWKGARTATWMKSKITDGKEQLVDSLKHHNRDPGIETEV